MVQVPKDVLGSAAYAYGYVELIWCEIFIP